MKERYNSRVWLNTVNSPSTGSIVCYYGNSSWDDREVDMFVEVASCHDVARIHKSRADTNKQYINKVKKMQKELTKYIEFLESITT